MQAEGNFLEEKLKRVKEVLQQLKERKKIKWFLGPFKRGPTFYVIYVDKRYIVRPLWVDHTKKKSIRVSLFESDDSLRRKILETIKRL
jgi:hypothetical protein